MRFLNLKTIPNILRKRWNILVYIWFGVMIIVLIYALSQPSLYQTDGTIIIRPRASLELDRDLVRALDTLSRGGEIGSTFTEIFSSNQVHRSSVRNLEIPPELQVGLDVNSNPVGGTNILEVQVKGNDPDTVIAFANEVTSETMKRVEEIYSVFELEPLDNFNLTSQPVRSNFEIIVTGFLLAVITSIGLVLLGEAALNSGILYEYLTIEPLLSTQRYIDFRLAQEISHSKHANYKFSIAMIKLFDRYSGKELSSVNPDIFSEIIQKEDLSGYYQPGTLEVIFPGSSAFSIFNKFRASFDLNNSIERVPDYGIKAGIIEYVNQDLGESGLVDLALEALSNQESDRMRKTYFFTNITIEDENIRPAVQDEISEDND